MAHDASASCAAALPIMGCHVSVVGPQYAAAHPVDLIITNKMMTVAGGAFVITDDDGKPMFKVNGKLLTLHDQRLIVDNADNPVLCLRQKVMTAHRRWLVYRGDSSDSRDLLFNVKKTSVYQMKSELDVFLVSNKKEEVPDFKVKGSLFESSATIYLGDSSTIIAQMHKKHSAKSILLGKEMLLVTVNPKVDRAFVTALLVALYEVQSDRKYVI